MSKIYSLTWQQVLEIETKLNEITFDGINIGGLLGCYLYFNFTFLPSITVEANFKFYPLYLKYRFFEKTSTTDLIIDKKIEYLFIYENTSYRFLEFYIPLLKYFTKGNLAFASERNNRYFDEYYFYSYYGLSKSLENDWRKLYKNFEKSFLPTVRKIIAQYHLPKSTIFFFKLIAVLQTKKLFYYYTYLKSSSVKAIVADHDRNIKAAPLILAAKRCGIKTYTLIHGATHPPYNYYPVLADYMFCWSHLQKKQMEDLGVASEQLLVAGNQKLSRNFNIDKHKTKEKYKLPPDKKIILIVTSPIALKERFQLVQEICSSLDADKFFILIRIHPVETKSEYGTLIMQGNTLIVDNSDQTIDESFICTDIAIIPQSTSVVIVDALVKNLPVILYAPPYVTAQMGIAKTAIDANAALYASDISHLQAQISSLNNQDVLNELRKNIQQYVADYCSYFGEDAVERIIAAILQ